MKVFISADIEGVNNIATWDETDLKSGEYSYFRKQMTEEVARACMGAKAAGADTIFVKDAHDSARNLILKDLPEYVTLHRGWQGCPCSMMAGLDESFDAVIFIGYHSPASSDGNPLSHTMNLRNQYVKINGVLYRFDYKFHIQVNTDILLAVNIILIIISIFVICVMSFIKRKILQLKRESNFI